MLSHMDLEPYLEELADNLATAAAVGDEESRRAAELLVVALQPAARLALMNAMSDLTAEVTRALDGPMVELRLDGRDVIVVVSPAHSDVDVVSAPPAPDPAGETSRITLRLPEAAKIRAEEAAVRQGVSLNTWLNQSVQAALQHDTHRSHGRSSGSSSSGSSRVSGWVTG
jgi:hypothetical protein